jgi:malate dehydrogenase
MVEAIVRDKKRVIASAAYCESEYGVGAPRGKGLFVGVPAVLGAKGVEKIISFKLDPTEQEFMNKSVAAVRGLIDVVNKLYPEMA